MSRNIVLEGDGGRVEIYVLEYERAEADNASDANWLRCRVAVLVDGFRGELALSVATYDFVDFGRQLKDVIHTLKGTATFDTDEGQLRLEIRMLTGGRAEVGGCLIVTGRPRAGLSFLFETDQTYIVRTLHDVQAVQGIFPVRPHA